MAAGLFGSGWGTSWGVTGNCLESQAVQFFSSALFQEKVSMCVLFPSIFCFLQPCCQSHCFSNQLRRLTLLMLDPGLGWPICLSNCSLPRRESPSLCNPVPLLCPLVKMQVQPNCFSSLPTWFCVYFFQSFVYKKSLFASLQFVFSEHCSTYRCIFDVFVGAGELCVLLLSHFIFISVLVF